MALFSRELGIDLGTFFLRVVEGNQLVLQEPTVAAIVTDEQKMVAWGQEAQDMLGKVPESSGGHPPVKQRRYCRLRGDRVHAGGIASRSLADRCASSVHA